MVAYPEAFNQAGYSDRVWIGMIALSTVCHGLFFLGILFLPDLGRPTRHMPTAVEVDLVSLPLPQGTAGQRVETATPPVEPIKAPEPKAPARAQEGVKKSKKETVEDEVSPPQETVSLTPTTPLEVKRSIKKKTYDASKAISRAIKKIEKQAPESRPRSVVQAIDQLKKEVHGVKGGGAAAGGSRVGTGISKERGKFLNTHYTAICQDHIERNWVLPEFLQGEEDLEAIVNVKIMRDGKIRDIWFEEKSGSKHFDESVLRAVKKSDPLPPLPKGFSEPFLEAGFRFNPSLLRRSP